MRHLKNAPIKEAIIELQVQPLVELSIGILKNLDIGFSYKSPEFIRHAQINVEGSPDGGLTVSTDDALIHGGVFRDEKRGFICQVMRERLTVSKVSPYSVFAELLEETKRLWEVYIQAFLPNSIARVSMRYINEINMDKELRFYLRNYKIDKLISDIESSHTYHRSELMKTERENAIVQIIVDRKNRDHNKLFIDIDAYSIIQTEIADTIIWSEIIPKIHKLKNDIFFGLITKKFEKEGV